MAAEGGAYARAVEEAVKELRSAAPRVIETSAGVVFRPRETAGGDAEGTFTFRFMNSEAEVAFPEGHVTVDGQGGLVSVTIVVLHYLTRSVGPLDLSEPVRFQGLPGAGAYTAAFRSHAEVPLLQRFGEDGDTYMAAVQRLGGRPAAGAAEDPEVVWEMPFLPHLPIGIRLGLAEDAMPADCVIMFPKRAGFAYHVEDLAVAGEILSERLLEAVRAAEVERTDGLAVLITLFDPVEADMVVSKLRSAGIESVVQPEALSVVYGLSMEGHGRHHVLVRTEDLAEAQGALGSGAEEV
jgi:hypothetical protein